MILTPISPYLHYAIKSLTKRMEENESGVITNKYIHTYKRVRTIDVTAVKEGMKIHGFIVIS
jgi:hypothetical protein